ncbi:hypothetical protein Bbelb_102000 [Branchiostoma belcheri]|nr:hypothetical protein Bbelb_102000 [Branchiostoma belcheri]
MSGHVTNPSYFISFVKPAPAKVACRLPEEHCSDPEREYNADHEWKPARGCKPASGRVQPGQREGFPAPGGASCRLGRSVLPPRAERECDPAVALQQPLPPDRATRHPEDSDSSLGIQFRVVGTGHSRRESRHGTQRRRGGCWTISKRETVGQFRAPEVLETVGQSQNLVRKTVRWFYGISLCWCIEVVGQSRSEKLKRLLDNLELDGKLTSFALPMHGGFRQPQGGWRWRADFGSLLIVFWSLGDYRQQEERQ